MKALIGVLFMLSALAGASGLDAHTTAGRQREAQAYCAGRAAANGVGWHETPEFPASNKWGAGFYCVIDTVPHCEYQIGKYCAIKVYWFELGKGK